MSAFPATTVRVTAIEPASDTKVRITLEMIVDVNRLAEVSSELLRATVKRADRHRRNKLVTRAFPAIALHPHIGRRNDFLAFEAKAFALVPAPGTFILHHAAQPDFVGKLPAREGQQGAADAAALMRGRDPKLVEIEIARMERQHGHDLPRLFGGIEIPALGDFFRECACAASPGPDRRRF